jgi:hypothetical protein
LQLWTISIMKMSHYNGPSMWSSTKSSHRDHQTTSSLVEHVRLWTFILDGNWNPNLLRSSIDRNLQIVQRKLVLKSLRVLLASILLPHLPRVVLIIFAIVSTTKANFDKILSTLWLSPPLLRRMSAKQSVILPHPLHLWSQITSQCEKSKPSRFQDVYIFYMSFGLEA